MKREYPEMTQPAEFVAPYAKQRKIRRIFIPIFGLFIVFLFITIFLPVIHHSDSRRVMNAAASANRLRTINTLQNKYAAEHPKKGFACELSLLQGRGSATDFNERVVRDADYVPEQFLASGAQSGYRFAVTGCRRDANGVVDHYQVTAVPVDPGKSGSYAFCIDDAGLLWIDKGGSGISCLASRILLK
jgi:hypothetical protein